MGRKRGVLDMLRERTLDSEDEERLEAPHERADLVTRPICKQAQMGGTGGDGHTCDGP